MWSAFRWLLDWWGRLKDIWETLGGDNQNRLRKLGAVIMPLTLSIWTWLEDQPLPVVITVFLASLTSLLVLIRLGLYFRDRFYSKAPTAQDKLGGTSLVQLYPSRDALLGLRTELKTADVAWASWWAGTHATTEEIYKDGIFTRLILLDPASELVKTRAKRFRRTDKEVRDDIEKTTKVADSDGVDVRWYDGEITSMILANPTLPTGWARVELDFPYLSPTSRPSLIVTKQADPTVFDELVASFQTAWSNSRKPIFRDNSSSEETVEAKILFENREPFVQEHDPANRLYRVAVVANVDLNSFSLVVSNVQPWPKGFTGTEIPLVKMHDRAEVHPNNRLCETWNAKAGDRLYFDVIEKNRHEDAFVVCHARRDHGGATVAAPRDSEYVFTLSIRHAKGEEAVFVAAVEKTGGLCFQTMAKK